MNQPGYEARHDGMLDIIEKQFQFQFRKYIFTFRTLINLSNNFIFFKYIDWKKITEE